MTRVLSIQSDTMGHRVYADTLTECFRRSGQLHYDSLWSHEGRSIPTRVLMRLATLRLPALSARERDLDLGRLRIEFANARMSRLLVARTLRQAPYDVLYFHTQVHALNSVSFMQAIPSVISLDMTACQVAADKRFPFTSGPIIERERRIFAAAAHLVAWSGWARHSLLNDYGIAAEKISVISPGVRLWQIGPPIVRARPMRRILFIGRDFERKGGFDLLHVFQRHFSHQAELHLVTDQTFDHAGPNVFVHNDVAAYSPQWQRILAAADIFVLPSSSEAFGLVLQEAAAFGAALIGSRVGAVPQMVREGENGFLIDPGDAAQLQLSLRRLIDDDRLRLRFRSRSRQLALAEFDAEKNARRLAELFESVQRTPSCLA